MKDFKINIQGFRYFNVYGNGEDHKGDQMSPVSKFTKQAKANQDIKLFENSENYKRDFVSIEDVCKIHEKMLDVDQSGIFNVGTGEAVSFKTIAYKIAYKYGVGVDLIPMPKEIAKNYQAYTCADNKKLQDILNYEFEYVIDWIDRQ
jgi:ADP-L-glycero-D-manno-heptose 6-epimerase